MAETKAPETEIDRLRKTGRNDSCPCGSGKKYKKCHLREDEEAERAWLSKVQEENQKAAEAEAEAEEKSGKKEGSGVPRKEFAAADIKAHAPKSGGGAPTQRNIPRKAQ